MKITDKTFCNEHPKETVSRVCLDPQCSHERGPFCPLCMGKIHSACHNQMKFKKSQLAEVLFMKDQDFDDSSFYAALLSNLETFFNDCRAKIITNMESSKAAFKEFKDKFKADPFEFLDEYERVIQIKFNSENKNIEIVHKCDNIQQLKKNCLKTIKKKLNNLSDFILKELAFNKWNIKSAVSAPHIDDLIRSTDFNIKIDGSGYDISREVKENKTSLLVYKNELRGGETFKIKITSINTDQRYLALGVTDSVGHKDMKENNYEDWAAGFSICYWGFGRSDNLSGKNPATHASDPHGFKPGDVVYLDFRLDVVTIYNEDRSINLISEKLKGSPPFYFFLGFACKETSAILERLW